jgi:hypothetical protein
MTVRVNKSSFNIREKLSELGRKFGLKGSELVAAETVQEARDVVSAGRKNLIINGDFRINQRSGTHTLISGYHLDRWKFQKDGLGQYAHSVTSSTDAPAGFSKSLRLEVTTTETSGISSIEDLCLTQEIEGQNLQLLEAGTNSAKPFTLSFWVKSTKPGTYCVSVVADPATNNKIFSTTYTINVANVWERKIIKIPPCTLTTIPNVSSKGMSVRWITLAGSAYTGATGGNLHEWDDYHSSLFAGGHQTQIDTDGDVWQLTGVQLELGHNATDFEHRSYGEELSLCQRYYGKIRLSNQEWIYNESNNTWGKWWMGYIPFSMRANPNIDSTDLTGGVSVSGLSGTVSSVAPQTPGDTPGRVSMRVNMSVDSGTAHAMYHTDGWAGDYLAFDAEL